MPWHISSWAVEVLVRFPEIWWRHVVNALMWTWRLSRSIQRQAGREPMLWELNRCNTAWWGVFCHSLNRILAALLAVAGPHDAPARRLRVVHHPSHLHSLTVAHTLGGPCRQPRHRLLISPSHRFDSSASITVLFNIADTPQCNDRNQQYVTTVANKRYDIIHNRCLLVWRLCHYTMI